MKMATLRCAGLLVFTFAVLLTSKRLGSADESVPIILQTGYDEGIEAVAFSPDAKWLATGGGDGVVKIWDAGSGTVIQELHTGSNVGSVTFSVDSKTVAAGTSNGVQLWDWKVAKITETVASREAHCLEFSPNGRWLAIGGEGRQALVLWDLLRHQVHGALKNGDFSHVSAMAFSPDSKRIVVSDDGTAVWDVEKAKLLKVLLWENMEPLAFSADGDTVMSPGAGGIRRFDVSGERPTGKRLPILPIGQRENQAATISPDGQWLAIATGESDEPAMVAGTAENAPAPGKTPAGAPGPAAPMSSQDEATPVKIYSIRSGKLVQTFTPGTFAGSYSSDSSPPLHFTRDGKTLLVETSSPPGFSVWDIQSGTLRWRSVAVSTAAMDGAALSRNGDELLISTTALWAFNLNADARNALPHSVPFDSQEPYFPIFPRPTLVIPGEEAPFKASIRKGRLQVVNKRTGQQQTFTLPGWKPTANRSHLLITPDGRTVAVPTNEGGSFYDVIRQKTTYPIKVTGEVVAAAFSPDSKIFGARLHDTGEILLWDVATGRTLPTIAGKSATHENFLFSSDGKTIAAGDERGSVTLYEMSTEKARKIQAQGTRARPLNFSSNGKLLLVVDDSHVLQCYSTSDGRLVASFIFLQAEAQAQKPPEWVAWLPDGTYESSPGAPKILRERGEDGLVPESSSRLHEKKGAILAALRGASQ